jgi:hypothetical protein
LGVLTYGQPAPSFRIAGHVVRRPSNQPVAGARVSIARDQHRERPLSFVTNENGEFSFTGLPPTKYTLQVEDHGRSQLFQQLDEFSTAIVVGSGLDSEHILFPLDSPASIAGSVRDEDGDPVREASVYLFSRFLFRGIFQTGLKGETNTGAGGTFRFSHLTSGIYYVAVGGRPWYAQNLPTPESGIREPRSEMDVAFPLTYYAGAATPEAATPIKLEEGAKAELQFTLHAVPALRIAFDGTEKEPGKQTQILLTQLGPGGTPIYLSTSFSGSEITGIAPGSYLFSASLPGHKQPTALGSQALSLTADSTVHLGNGIKTSVSGKVILDGNIPRSLAIWMGNVANGNVAFGGVAQDGSFDIAQIPPGRYELLLANDPDLYLQKVTVKGSVFANGEIEVPAGAQIELTITAAAGLSKVNGMVLKDKRPTAGAMVLLLPQDLSHGRYMPRDQSDSDGTFTLYSAAPGRYTLLAIEDGRGLAYGDPAVMAPYLAGGRVVEVPVLKDSRVEVEVQPRR